MATSVEHSHSYNMKSFFQRIQAFWCRFTFPNKPPASGAYPYYGGCHTRNYTNQYFCYNPQNSAKTINTFITAMWSGSFQWFIHLTPTWDQVPYKCCQPPPGYYIDYTSCYYQVTHDPFFEYYDNTNFYIVVCANGYVMTGISKKINPYDHEYHIEWIQCCRMGFGPYIATPPPVTTNPTDGSYSLYSPRSNNAPLTHISEAYRGQYRTVRSAVGDDETDEYFVNKTLQLPDGQLGGDADMVAYLKRKTAKEKRKKKKEGDKYENLTVEALDRPLVKFSTAGEGGASY
ncbi:uncharacterized protein LOC129595397 [Paramacrobiotus metropolitanus]|uniref:uncharacterized protein LOC129595397 n=1 Tax=Paramacrobiotus metropolitanus TaxID=2943436 RepID=UPI002445A082|nr:uncharacterized protein LOC129595397 [Paramacrobiotus metropolitanus]